MRLLLLPSSIVSTFAPTIYNSSDKGKLLLGVGDVTGSYTVRGEYYEMLLRWCWTMTKIKLQ